MSKSKSVVDTKQVSDSIRFKHSPEILTCLQTDSEYCDFRAEALALAEFGLRVHPLKPRQKAPALKGWQAKATTDPDVIIQWDDKYPTANVGIVTGAESRVIVLDVDLRNGGLASLQELERKHGDLPLSWSVLTPGGSHLYLRHPGDQVRSCELAPGIDLRGDDGNVVAPGSIHPSGLSYQWQGFSVPGVVDLAEPPEWLLNLLKRKGKWVPPGEVRPELSQVDLLGADVLGGQALGRAGSLTGAQIRSLYAQESVVKRVLEFLGLGEVGIGEKFHCILHDEEHASAAIMPPREVGDPYLYMDFHERESRRGFPLPFVYYRLKGGPVAQKVRRLPEPSFLVWSLRLLRDAGVLGGVCLDAPPLPSGTKPSIEKVYEGFQELLSLRFLVERAASAYSWTFIQSWTGLSKRAVEAAMKWLLDRGFLQFVKWFGSEETGNRVMLFRIGTRGLVRRREAVPLTTGSQASIVDSVKEDVAVLERVDFEQEQAKQAKKFCKKCGEISEWYTFAEMLACKGCYGMLDTC